MPVLDWVSRSHSRLPKVSLKSSPTERTVMGTCGILCSASNWRRSPITPVTAPSPKTAIVWPWPVAVLGMSYAV